MSGRLTLLLAALVLVAACGRVDNSTHVEPIRQLVESTPDWVGEGDLAEELWATTREFYEARGHRPAWIEGVSPTPGMTELLQELRAADLHGLDPATYGVDEFERLEEASETRFRGTRFEVEQVPALDTRLTYAYLRYATDLLGWSSNPRNVFRHWAQVRDEADLAARLEQAVDAGTVRDSLEQLAPSHPQYQGLQAALARARQTPDTDIDVERVRMNMERWRWLPRDLGDRYVLVNVPAYQLQVMEDGKPVLAMRVIVGEPETPTPIFSDEMTHVVFSPFWNIPESILREETLPRVAADPSFLERNNIEVVSTSGDGGPIDPTSVDWTDEGVTEGVRFRQRPGPSNALGLVKFIFPNNFNVYLHDTPGGELFERDHRTLSHGCVRIEEPVAMAEYVLRDQPDWTTERITAAMQARTERAIELTEPLQVHIGYWTAWVQPDGSVAYFEDPYGIDDRHARELAARDDGDIRSSDA